MKRQRVDSQLPRRFIQGLITSKDFLSAAAADLDVSLIQSPHLQRVARWCLEYFEAYHEPPKRAIEPIFYSWFEKLPEPSPDAEAIKSLLGELSADYEAAGEINVPYLLDEMGRYLTLRRVDRLRADLEDELFSGDVDAAVLAIDKFRAPSVGRSVGLEPLNDLDVWDRAFIDGEEPIIEFSGAAGRFFNSAMTRESLIAIQGPEKRGKTWWCLEFAIRALLQRRKVAFFEVGDLTESQLLRRFGVRISGQPMWSSQCGEIALPSRILFEEGSEAGDDGIKVEYDLPPKDCPVAISVGGCRTAVDRFHRRCGTLAGQVRFLVSVHPTSTVRVSDLDAILTRWEVEKDFVPDVIIVDYADILAPENPQHQIRDQTNTTWASLRRLSQERRCLVLAPTQADAASYRRSLLTMSNFSEDKRKMAHVTGMLGLNQTISEKSLSVMRLNWIVLRESPFSVSQCLAVAQCLSLGRAMCCSCMRDGVS